MKTWTRSPATILAAILLVAGLVSIAKAPPSAAATTIDQLREKARKIEAKLEDLQNQVEVVNERYRQVQDRLAQTNAHLESTKERIGEARQNLDQRTSEARLQIVQMYENQALASAMGLLGASNMEEFAAVDQYTNAIAQDDHSIATNLRVLRENLKEEEQILTAQQRQVAADEKDLADQRQQVEALVAKQKDELSKVNGRLARLVEEERQRRAAEEARKARVEMARKAAVEKHSHPAPPPPAVSGKAAVAVKTAMDQIGKPYRWGGSGPSSFDCSGLTRYAWLAAGVSLPHSSAAQKRVLPSVPLDRLQPGDLVFYGHPVHHVGMYIGNGQMVDAPYPGQSVRIDSIHRSDYAGAGRPG